MLVDCLVFLGLFVFCCFNFGFCLYGLFCFGGVCGLALVVLRFI